jgi:hypothetical protein
MRAILAVLLLAVVLCVSACESPRVKSNTENLNLVIIPFNNKDMEKAVSLLKENMIFFKVKNKCFGCVFVYPNERAIPCLVEVTCDGLE